MISKFSARGKAALEGDCYFLGGDIFQLVPAKSLSGIQAKLRLCQMSLKALK